MYSLKLIVLLAFLFLGVTTQAQNTFYVDIDATANGNGSSWANSFNNLQTAINFANSGDLIRMSDGIYPAPTNGFLLKDGVRIEGGYNVRTNGSGNIVPDWLINATRFFNGGATDIMGLRACFLANSNLTSSTVIDGINMYSNPGNTYTHVSMISLEKNIPFNTFNLSVSNCTFGKSSSSDFAGIGVKYNTFSGVFDSFRGTFAPSISNCVFNTAYGVRIQFYTHTVGVMNVNNTQFNSSQSSIHLYSPPLVYGNSANIEVNIHNSLLKVNSREAIRIEMEAYDQYSFNPSDVEVNMTNSIVQGLNNNGSILSAYNTASAVHFTEVNLNATNCTFYDLEKGIYMLKGSSNFRNSIFWDFNNILPFTGGTHSFESCLVDANSCSSIGTLNTNVNCQNVIYNQNPQFVSTDPVSINFLKLSSTSPARNVGNNTYAAGRGYGGNDRILEGIVDIGAYEFCPSGGICRTISSVSERTPSPKIATKNIENNVENLLVYPNPVKDVVKVKSSDKILSIEILNTQGQVISSSQDSNSVELSNVAKGMYLLRITTDEGIQTKRIIKE